MNTMEASKIIGKACGLGENINFLNPCNFVTLIHVQLDEFENVNSLMVSLGGNTPETIIIRLAEIINLSEYDYVREAIKKEHLWVRTEGCKVL